MENPNNWFDVSNCKSEVSDSYWGQSQQRKRYLASLCISILRNVKLSTNYEKQKKVCLIRLGHQCITYYCAYITHIFFYPLHIATSSWRSRNSILEDWSVDADLSVS